MRGRFDYIRLKVPPDCTRIFALLFVQFLVPGIPHCFHWLPAFFPTLVFSVSFHVYILIFRVRVLIEFQRVFFLVAVGPHMSGIWHPFGGCHYGPILCVSGLFT